MSQETIVEIDPRFLNEGSIFIKQDQRIGVIGQGQETFINSGPRNFRQVSRVMESNQETSFPMPRYNSKNASLSVIASYQHNGAIIEVNRFGDKSKAEYFTTIETDGRIATIHDYGKSSEDEINFAERYMELN